MERFFVELTGLGFFFYFYSKEGDVGEEVYSGFEVLEFFRVVGWEVILLEGRREAGLRKKVGR